jgi:ppGpp synthetase/RelA/SpoT-type nucleotidyltranferase
MKYQLDMHGEMLMEQYHERIHVYERLSHLADEALRKALDAQHVKVTAMEHRIKTESSLAGKLELKGAKYRTLDDVTDIVGMRVVTFYSADVDKVAAIVNEVFQVDWNNSVDKRKLHRLDSFGYNSLHYICKLPKSVVDDSKMPLLNELRFEIQMRTALQHVWSTLDHDTAYKGNVKIPNEYRRQFNRLAGMLELIDEEFSRLRNTLTEYSRQMLALEASGRLDEVYLNVDTFRRYIEAQPFARLNQRIASINQAEIQQVNLSPFLRLFENMGFKTLGDIDALVKNYFEAAYQIACFQIGLTDIDILSSSVAPQNLCTAYILKNGGGCKELKQMLDTLSGPSDGNEAMARFLLEQTKDLPFMNQ